jgi:hypothetical protein
MDTSISANESYSSKETPEDPPVAYHAGLQGKPSAVQPAFQPVSSADRTEGGRNAVMVRSCRSIDKHLQFSTSRRTMIGVAKTARHIYKEASHVGKAPAVFKQQHQFNRLRLASYACYPRAYSVLNNGKQQAIHVR